MDTIIDESKGKVIKASFFYVMCSFLLKGISFITIPFFSRLLTQDEYGYISNFNSWLSILTIVTTLSLIASLASARFDYEKHYDSYISTILLLGMFFSILCFAAILWKLDYLKRILMLDRKYVVLLALCAVSQSAYDIFLQNQRFRYKYKLVTSMTVIVTLVSVGMEFLFIYLFEDNSWGMALGTELPMIATGLLIYIYYFRKSLKLKLEYCLYALKISVPYIFHLLSSVLLCFADRAMITSFCGTRENAIYSMAYNIGLIINVVWMAFNQAFAPWLGEKLNVKDYEPIRKITPYYMMVFCVIFFGLLLIGPETLLILGGHRYIESVALIPVVMISYVAVFVNSLYVSILQLKKHTFGMACATISSAVINVMLNYILIPNYGYMVAAYTTFISYLAMLLMNLYLVKRIGFMHVYKTKNIFAMFAMMIVVSFSMCVLYKTYIIRYIILAMYLLLIGYIVYRYRGTIKGLIHM